VLSPGDPAGPVLRALRTHMDVVGRRLLDDTGTEAVVDLFG